MKTLRDVKIRETVIVVKLHGEGAVKRRMLFFKKYKEADKLEMSEGEHSNIGVVMLCHPRSEIGAVGVIVIHEAHMPTVGHQFPLGVRQIVEHCFGDQRRA